MVVLVVTSTEYLGVHLDMQPSGDVDIGQDVGLPASACLHCDGRKWAPCRETWLISMTHGLDHVLNRGVYCWWEQQAPVDRVEKRAVRIMTWSKGHVFACSWSTDTERAGDCEADPGPVPAQPYAPQPPTY